MAQNKFGEGELVQAADLQGGIYTTCSACMSVYADFLSWAQTEESYRMTTNPAQADNILVLSCQVTDLAVLHDIRVMERLQREYPGKRYLFGGCLAQRFDIPLPGERLDHTRQDYKHLNERGIIHYEPPFWIKDWREKTIAVDIEDGHLFREMYPLRIGVGCGGKCTYCTIRHTRGPHYNLTNHNLLLDEFLAHENVVLIADSPTAAQLKWWCQVSLKFNKQVSFRNVEPQTAIAAGDWLHQLVRKGLLPILHVPIQHTNPKVLERMQRSVAGTYGYLEMTEAWAQEGTSALETIYATNIIVDYPGFPDPDRDVLERAFDYISWNPYWDGIWDRAKAEERFKAKFGV